MGRPVSLASRRNYLRDFDEEGDLKEMGKDVAELDASMSGLPPYEESDMLELPPYKKFDNGSEDDCAVVSEDDSGDDSHEEKIVEAAAKLLPRLAQLINSLSRLPICQGSEDDSENESKKDSRDEFEDYSGFSAFARLYDTIYKPSSCEETDYNFKVNKDLSALKELADAFHASLGNPTSYKVPEFMAKIAKDGRFDIDTAEKFAFRYFNEPPERKYQIDGEFASSCMSVAFAAPADERLDISIFLQTTMSDARAYATSPEKRPGMQTEERDEIFSRYAVVVNYCEILGGKSYDIYDLGLGELKPRVSEFN